MHESTPCQPQKDLRCAPVTWCIGTVPNGDLKLLSGLRLSGFSTACLLTLNHKLHMNKSKRDNDQNENHQNAETHTLKIAAFLPPPQNLFKRLHTIPPCPSLLRRE